MLRRVYPAILLCPRFVVIPNGVRGVRDLSSVAFRIGCPLIPLEHLRILCCHISRQTSQPFTGGTWTPSRLASHPLP